MDSSGCSQYRDTLRTLLDWYRRGGSEWPVVLRVNPLEIDSFTHLSQEPISAD
jgi:hypothetical protein